MSSQPKPEERKVTTRSLLKMKERGDQIAALTAYDFLMAQLLDDAGVDVILVGDSAGMVIQGTETTVGVTMDQMLYHSAVVSRGVKRALVVADMPFMSFQVNPDEALRNAGRMVKESSVEAVKLEGGEKICGTIRRIVDVGIPVMGHLGLTPQSIHKFGTYQVRARDPEEADEVRRDAKALQDAGVFAIVVEKVPAELATEISESVDVPIIGMGGIVCVRDVVEFMLAGASAVQIGTANYNDPSIAGKIALGVEEWCRDRNVADVGDLIGAATKD